MAAIPNNRALARPAKDEWGVYDPQQAGLAALFARLDTKETKTSSPASRLSVAPAQKQDTPATAPATRQPLRTK
jgi:hypothetical protein